MCIMLFKRTELALYQSCHLFDLHLIGLRLSHSLDNLVDRIVISELLLRIFEHSRLKTKVPLVHKLREVLVGDEALHYCNHEAKIERID